MILFYRCIGESGKELMGKVLKLIPNAEFPLLLDGDLWIAVHDGGEMLALPVCLNGDIYFVILFDSGVGVYDATSRRLIAVSED